MIEVKFMADESGIAPGEENLTPEERLRIHTAEQVITPENAPTWWEHWVANVKDTASLLNEEGKIWRADHRLFASDVFLIAWLTVTVAALIVGLVMVL